MRRREHNGKVWEYENRMVEYEKMRIEWKVWENGNRMVEYENMIIEWKSMRIWEYNGRVWEDKNTKVEYEKMRIEWCSMRRFEYRVFYNLPDLSDVCRLSCVAGLDSRHSTRGVRSIKDSD